MADLDTSFYTQSQPNAFLGTAQQAVGIQGQQIANQQAQQNLVTQQVQYLAGGLGVLAKKPDLSQADMVNFANGALKEGIISPQTYQVEMQNVQAAGNDPVKLQALATNYSQRALDAGQKFSSMFNPATMNTGSHTLTGNLDPITGTFTPASSFQQGLSPESAATPEPVPTIGPDGKPTGGTTLTTLGNFANSVNGNNLTAPAAAAPASGGNQLSGPTPATPAAPVPLAPLPPQPKGIPSMSPQDMAMSQASTAQYQQAKQNDSNYQANLVPLEKSLSLLPDTPLFGKGAQIPTDVAQVLNTFGIPIGSDQAKNAAELQKYLTQIARSSGAAPGSDQQLAAAFSANPNMDTDKAAAQDVLKTMISLQRMQHAVVATADAQGVQGGSYSDFARQKGSTLDPRAFGVDLMSDQAKAALLKQLQSNPAAKAKFAQSLRFAANAGVLGDGGGQ